MILVTGGAGFIGANFVLDWLAGSDEPVLNLDKLTYAGNLGNLSEVAGNAKHVFIRGDIGDRDLVRGLLGQHRPRAIVNFAAESHVDRSIHGPGDFIQTNVLGSFHLLEEVRAYWSGLKDDERAKFRFLHVSTDEVYGSLGPADPAFSETTPYAPNSPYSASKAAGDCLVRSYFHTFGLPVLTTRCSNNYGPYHFPEKLIPLFVTNLMEGKKVPLYGDGMNVRDWLYVEDHCDAIWTVLNKGRMGEVYNIGGNNELTNRRITEVVLLQMGKNWDESVQYVKDRPGHDRRYAIDAGKMKNELGWEPKHRFEQAIQTTIDWYRTHESWWRGIKSGEYLKYYQQQYTGR